MAILVERHDLEFMNAIEADMAIADDLLQHGTITKDVYKALQKEYEKAKNFRESYLHGELDTILMDLPCYRSGPTFVLADDWGDETLEEWWLLG